MPLWLLFPAPHVYPTDSARQLPGQGCEGYDPNHDPTPAMPQRTRDQVWELSGLASPAGMGTHTRRSTDVKILAANGAVSPIRSWAWAG